MLNRAWATMAILWIAYVFSLVDRQALSLMLEPIRLDIGASDTEMGFLHGVTFAAFYGLAGLPIAYLVDRGSRRLVIAGGFFVWSLGTVVCGMSRLYPVLLIGRIGVAAGEASLVPSANSIIADLFAPAQRGRATGIFASAIPVGFGIALFGVGLLYDWASSLDLSLALAGELAAWQIVFLVLGLSGCLLSVLPLLVPEPPRTTPVNRNSDSADLRAYLRVNSRLLILFLTGVGAFAMAGYATLAWFPTLLMREFAWEISEIGIALGVAITGPGLAGTIGGGLLADRLVRHGHPDGKLRVCALAVGLAIAPLGLVAVVPSGLWATAALALFALCAGAFWTVAPAAIQDMTPGTFRGRLTAAYGAIVNLIGIGLGPLSVGLMTDSVFGRPNAIGLALAVTTTIALVAAAILFIAILPGFRRTVAVEMGRIPQ